MAFLHKMYLYLKNKESERWLTVQLVDGHIPKVAGLSGDDMDTLSVGDNFVPAIWFRVMVLQSINVDCEKRVVCWTNGKLQENGEPVTSWLSGEDTFFDWDDDLDELFNIANVLISNNPLAEPNEEQRKERIINYEQNLFKMLHVYILPKIELHPGDLDSVQTALKAQNKSITQLEDITMMHTRLAEHYMNQMKNIRDNEILPILNELVQNKIVNKEFKTALMYDIIKAEPLLRIEVDKAQQKVDKFKNIMAKGAVSVKIAKDLADARNSRDKAHDSLVRLIVGKALVQTSLDKVKDTSEGLNESCLQYIKLYKRVQDEKRIARETVDKQLRAISVRECIHSVIQDLEKDKSTYGEDPELTPTKPEWQTLGQRLTSIVHNKEHPVGLRFAYFTNTLQIEYRKVLQSAENVVYGSNRFMTSFKDFYVISEQDLGLNKMYLEDQRNIILGHLHQISMLLAEHFSKRTAMFVRKVRLCYEKCFFNRVGRDLILVYRVVHGKVMQTLETRIAALREVSICKLGLQMRAEWWLELFETNEDISSDKNSYVSFDDESHHGSFAEEYGDDESGSDIEDKEFCSDSENDSTPMYGMSGSEHEQIKKNLLKSKSKILSRSMPDIPNIDLIHHQATQMSKAFEEKSTSEFSTDRFSRYLEAESEDDLTSKKIQQNLRRCHSLDLVSTSHPIDFVLSSSEKNLTSTETAYFRNESDTFEKHFGKALSSIKGIFMNSSPLKKMQCLTNALRHIACKVEELRLRTYKDKNVDPSKIAVTAEDLLPLLVLVLLKMAPHDVAKLYTEILFISDLMADFLSSGCHSYALCEFQIAFRVLDQTCEELKL